jgi:hypothetical protein
MSKEREEGISSFFEDIPVLIVVTIAIGIFLFSLVHAYVVYVDQLEHMRMHDKSRDFCRSIRTYDGLTHDLREGVFLDDKVTSLSSEVLEEDFNPRTLGYNYQVSIIDTSDYSDSNNYTKSFRTDDIPSRGDRYSHTTSILIKVDSNYHAAQLIVTIWS